MRKKIVAGNWKMNKTPKEAAEFCKLMKEKVVSDAVEVVFCVPFVDLYPVLASALVRKICTLRKAAHIPARFLRKC